MKVQFGNLTIKEAEERMGVTGLEKFIKDKELIRITTCSEIKNHKNGFHIFDMPFGFSCGSEETALGLHGFLKDLKFKNTIDVQFNY